MSLLAPLGLLGLIGLIVLIIIYIIKPNFQSKFISSTYIWKLSLKYRKKRIPISKLRNIIIFICQVIILTAAAFVIAQPYLDDKVEVEGGEVVLIIDASASMQAATEQQTRLERAALSALTDATEALENGKRVTLILASDKASYLLQQVDSENARLVTEAFQSLTDDPKSVLTYGTPDIDGAIDLAEEITAYNKDVTVTLYTDTTYLNAGEIKIHDVKDPSEWNAAVLDVRTTIIENYYRIEIDVAAYGADSLLSVDCEIADVNNTGSVLEIEKDVYCIGDQITTLVFGFISEDMPATEAETIDEDIEVYAYDNIHVSIKAQDSLEADNQFYLYGGHKPVLKIQYYSALFNNYYTTALLVLQNALKDQWTLEITEVYENPATEGFDVYIFEHTAPATVPSDGLVIYTNAANIPATAGIRLGSNMTSSSEVFLTAGESHPIMKNINASNVSVTMLSSVTSYDGYIPLMNCEGYPAMLLKEDVDQRILVMPFSLHYSNFAMTLEFPLLFSNLINYFFPVTIEDYVYETFDKISANARADVLEVSGPGTNLTFDSFPAEWVVEVPGTYTLMQTPFSGNTSIENIYVHIPEEESNIGMTEDILVNPYYYSEADSDALDLLFYLALIMVALLFIEWWLKSREQI